jgi:hypothetical protein
MMLSLIVQGQHPPMPWLGHGIPVFTGTTKDVDCDRRRHDGFHQPCQSPTALADTANQTNQSAPVTIHRGSLWRGVTALPVTRVNPAARI